MTGSPEGFAIRSGVTEFVVGSGRFEVDRLRIGVAGRDRLRTNYLVAGRTVASRSPFT